MYNSAMTALARGANLLMPRNYNLEEPISQLTAFNEYISRAQVLLRGGRHVCDIAVLYPLHSLASQTNLLISRQLDLNIRRHRQMPIIWALLI